MYSSNIGNSMFNGSIAGNVYDQGIKNSIAFGNMEGFDNPQTDADRAQKPYKFIGSAATSYLTNCYEVDEEEGNTRVTEATISSGQLKTIPRAELNKGFYVGLGFNADIWDLDNLSEKGYPELK